MVNSPSSVQVFQSSQKPEGSWWMIHLAHQLRLVIFSHYFTPWKFNSSPLKNGWVGRLLSFWDGIFSGAMLNFRRVHVSLSIPSELLGFLPSTPHDLIKHQCWTIDMTSSLHAVLVGGWTNPSEKLGSSNWIISPFFGVKIPKIFETYHHLVV